MNYLILGGTGTLGAALTKNILKNKKAKILIVSRDEHKQKALAQKINNERLAFRLGDIRDRELMFQVTKGIDHVFLVAALKHVDTLEDNPEEALKTNVIGTMNVADAAIANGVKRVVFSSTDKAVLPINAYGMSKAMAEKILMAKNGEQFETRFIVYRWGNIIGSNGSVLHSFVADLRKHQKVKITDPTMTRFWIRIEDAVDFMLSDFMNADPKEVRIPPNIKSLPVMDFANSVARCLKVPMRFTIVGMRPGEKIHESLLPGFTSNDSARLSPDEIESMVNELL